MKQKVCKNAECKARFTPDRQMQTTCSPLCAIKYAQQRKAKEDRKRVREYRASDRVLLLKKAQTAFNAYIRRRDGKKCISCGYEGEGRQFHAGHYKSQGGNSLLRFHEDNVHSQCQVCNNHLSGNLAEYRKNLIEKIGIEKVEWLESTKGTKKWSVEELKEIIKNCKMEQK